MANPAQLRKIHVMRRDARWREEEYREVLRKRFGVDSSKDLDNEQCTELIDLLAASGARDTTPRKKERRAPNPKGLLTPKQQRFIADLYRRLGWTTMAQMMGFNEHCCRKKLPQTHADGTKVILGLQAMLKGKAALDRGTEE